MIDRRPTLVVVEDDEHVRRALGRFLTARGYVVRAFASAEAWLEDFGAADGAVIDINLPGMSGVELDERLRRGGNAIPTVFVTALDPPTAARAGRVILQKPVEPQALVDALEGVLAPRERRRVSGDLSGAPS